MYLKEACSSFGSVNTHVLSALSGHLSAMADASGPLVQVAPVVPVAQALPLSDDLAVVTSDLLQIFQTADVQALVAARGIVSTTNVANSRDSKDQVSERYPAGNDLLSEPPPDCFVEASLEGGGEEDGAAVVEGVP